MTSVSSVPTWSGPRTGGATAAQPGSRVASGADLQACRELLTGRRWTCLTGAGMSTDSGIPDYRGPDSPKASPMMFAEFAGSAQSRRRYWARSFVGWSRMGLARPNAGHRALAALAEDVPGRPERVGELLGVVTQNVDGLHAEAGSAPVVDLHGRIADVICLDCGDLSSRAVLQDRLSALNPDLVIPRAVGHAELRPDGDAVVEDWQDFVLIDCDRCGGRLKPDVVFFGESVPRERVPAAYALVEAADVLLVAGSSLTVMSGLRFVRHNARAGKSVIILNRGTTRGDEFATLKIDAGCSEVLTALL